MQRTKHDKDKLKCKLPRYFQ